MPILITFFLQNQDISKFPGVDARLVHLYITFSRNSMGHIQYGSALIDASFQLIRILVFMYLIITYRACVLLVTNKSWSYVCINLMFVLLLLLRSPNKAFTVSIVNVLGTHVMLEWNTFGILFLQKTFDIYGSPTISVVVDVGLLCFF